MNSRRSVSFVALLLFVGLLLPTLAMGSATPIADGASTYVVRVPAEAAPMLNGLSLTPRLALDYNTFHWLELSEADFAALLASGVPFTLVPEAGTVRVLDFAFDPLVGGEPSLPLDMQAEVEGPGFRLVQLVGPAKDDWLAQLQGAGLVPLQYYPHNSYLTWATATQSESAEGLAFVRWQGAFHPAYKISSALTASEGRIENVAVTFYNVGSVERTLADLTRLGGELVQDYPAQPDGAFHTAILTLDAARLTEVARVPAVWALEYASPVPGLDDEVGAQITAGNYPSGTPVTGYHSWLAGKGVDGGGITWADVDTGLNASHPDLTGRVVAYVTYPGAPAANTDPDGHGSHTAGAIMGDGKNGTTIADPNGFYWGTGAAPAASLVVQNALYGSSWPPAGGWQVLSRDSLTNGALGSSNSWYTGAEGSQGYSAHARTHDIMVRDGNWDTPSVAEPIVMVFSAGNAGSGCGSSPCYTSITEPKEAKNLIVVGASANFPRIGASVNDIASFSSRGPAQDGRLLPTLMAPGRWTASFNGTGSATCGDLVAGPGSAYYNYCSGTSMAAPFISGASALIADWWDQQAWGAPSPAMVKALLIIGASDMVGGDNGQGSPNTHIPNNDQGWGLVTMDHVILPGVNAIYRDQLDVLADSGDSWTLTVSIPDPTKPFKVSVVWTDAPGAVGANPALVNNLDLVVNHGSDTYYGNQFSSGWSTPGGGPDTLNNLENVYIQNPGGTATVTVQATNIAGDGVPYNGDATDQDFAFVCHNCTLKPDFALNAQPPTLDVCVPDDAVYTVTLDSLQSFDDAVTLHTSGEPAGTTAQFSVNPVIPPGTSVLTVTDTASATPGSYGMDIVGVAPTTTHTTTVSLHLYDAVPGAVTLLSPADGAMDVASTPGFDWTDASQGAAYALQVSTDPTFGTLDVGATDISTSAYTLTSPLDPGTCYFWRASGENACGVGGWAEPFRFATLDLDAGFSDDMESGDGQWSHAAAQGTDGWQISTAQAHSPTHAWSVPNAALITDSYLWNTTPVPVSSGSTLTFWHRYQFEGDGSDGSVLELSTNGGGSWQDLGPHITANGYNGTISSKFGNPLGGRDAWTGNLTTWTEVTVDLSSFAGQTAQIRWRLGCDEFPSDGAWYIDDVTITGTQAPRPAPILLSITPNAGSPAVETPVQIEGSGFVDPPSARLDDTWLLTVTWVSSTTLDAVVPAGMALGVYDLTLYNGGDCQAATLADAYTVGECVSPTVELASDSPVELGQPMVFTATATGTAPFTYTWGFGGPGTGGGLDTATPVFTYTAAGSYTAMVTVENACGLDTATATAMVLEPTLVLTKTVGTDTTHCAATSLITVPSGTGVIYCYEVLNTSEVTYTLHSLADSHLGTILAGASYTLAPGTSYWVTASASITQTTVNTATWTAYWDASLSTRAAAQAKVVVKAPAHLLYLPVIVRSASP